MSGRRGMARAACRHQRPPTGPSQLNRSSATIARSNTTPVQATVPRAVVSGSFLADPAFMAPRTSLNAANLSSLVPDWRAPLSREQLGRGGQLLGLQHGNARPV